MIRLKKKSQEKNLKYLKTDKNENTTSKLRNTTKAIIRGKFIVINADI